MRILAFILFVAVITGGCLTARKNFSEEAWRARVDETDPALLYAPHFRDGRFFNPWMPMEEKSFLGVIGWKLSKKGRVYSDEEKRFLPAVVPDPAARIRALGDADFILWAGHNTFIIRIDGRWWITDPIFSDRALLPKRLTPPGITPEELAALAPRINVIISHNHYDHLDAASIRKLPADASFYVPKGIRGLLSSLGRHDVTEMDWWEETGAEGGARVTCLPAQHWSKRIDQATDSTLWASYLLVTPGLTLYLGGDSGYFIGYREFGRRFPGIDYALIPTTAYHPRWFMHYPHLDIDEALRAFSELGARRFIPTQWGTFALGDEPPGYPALDLRRAIESRGLDPKRFLIMDIGGIEVLERIKGR